MELTVEPRVGRVDTVPRVVVAGAPGPLSVEVVTTDAAGHRWRSLTTCPVGADAALVVERKAHDPEPTLTHAGPPGCARSELAPR